MLKDILASVLIDQLEKFWLKKKKKKKKKTFAGMVSLGINDFKYIFVDAISVTIAGYRDNNRYK